MTRMGGLLRKMPLAGTALLMAMMAGCGLPGFANFAGEITIFLQRGRLVFRPSP